jgi:hypothetical protein
MWFLVNQLLWLSLNKLSNNCFRSPRRSSSLFPPIDEDHVTSGEDSPMSFGAISSNRASCVSGHNYQVTQQPRGAAIRSSTSSGIIKLRKSSDMLRVPSNIEHGTLVRTRSQEQVERLTEFLFSGKERNELLLDPNSIFSDDASRRASSTSSGKRKISVDHLLANFGISSGRILCCKQTNKKCVNKRSMLHKNHFELKPDILCFIYLLFKFWLKFFFFAINSLNCSIARAIKIG